MLQLLLGRSWPIYASFHKYLERCKYRVINKDQWNNILEFSRTIAPDMANYDENGACELYASAASDARRGAGFPSGVGLWRPLFQ